MSYHHPFYKETTEYYFAYGSNMSRRQMRHRCPRATYMGAALLSGWALAERMFADIDRKRGNVVHGIAWKVTPSDVRALDSYEGVSCGLYEKTYVYITLEDGTNVRALVYTETARSKQDREGVAFSLSYAALCAEAAAECEIPVHDLYKNRILSYSKAMGRTFDLSRESQNG